MRVTDVQVVDRYRLEVRFEDGTAGEVDLSELLATTVFSAWAEPGAFEDVSIGSGGELQWACGLDLCADALYVRLTGKSPSELYPTLDRLRRSA